MDQEPTAADQMALLQAQRQFDEEKNAAWGIIVQSMAQADCKLIDSVRIMRAMDVIAACAGVTIPFGIQQIPQRPQAVGVSTDDTGGVQLRDATE